MLSFVRVHPSKITSIERQAPMPEKREPVVSSERRRRVDESFSNVGRRRSTEFYLPVSAAHAYVDACAKESLAILGAEGVRLEGSTTVPDLTQMADFSSAFSTSDAKWRVVVDQCARWTHDFLTELSWAENSWLVFAVAG